MAYTPQLDYQQSCTLRRLAWALGKPMSKAITDIINYLPDLVDCEMVCQACKDSSKCHICQFNPDRCQVAEIDRTCQDQSKCSWCQKA
jgi:hypothetical protein